MNTPSEFTVELVKTVDLISEIVSNYQFEKISPETAMSDIAAAIADFESGTDV